MKVFRIKKHLTQAEMAERIKVGRALFGHVERGFQKGSADFWMKMKTAFSLSESEVEELKKIDD